MRTGISSEATSSPPSPAVETTLLEVITALQEVGLCDDQIVEAIEQAIDKHELHLLGQFRDCDLVRAA